MLKSFKDLFVFDAYTVTIEASPIDVFDYLSNDLLLSLEPAKASLGYDYSYRIFSGADSVGYLQYGGDNTGGRVYVSILGSYSQVFYDHLSRSSFVYYVVRADVKFDYIGSDVFNSLYSRLVDLAKQKFLKTSLVGDWVQNKDGRTLYIGSRSSVYMLRMYEKFKQTQLLTSEEVCRLELEVKPKGEQRLRAREFTPLDFISSCAWASEFFNSLNFGVDVIPALGTIRKQTDQERSYAWLKKQYLTTLRKQFDIFGGCEKTFINDLLGLNEVSVSGTVRTRADNERSYEWLKDRENTFIKLHGLNEND